MSFPMSLYTVYCNFLLFSSFIHKVYERKWWKWSEGKRWVSVGGTVFLRFRSVFVEDLEIISTHWAHHCHAGELAFDDGILSVVHWHRVMGFVDALRCGWKEGKYENTVYVFTCATNSFQRFHGGFIDLSRCCRWIFYVCAVQYMWVYSSIIHYTV